MRLKLQLCERRTMKRLTVSGSVNGILSAAAQTGAAGMVHDSWNETFRAHSTWQGGTKTVQAGRIKNFFWVGQFLSYPSDYSREVNIENVAHQNQLHPIMRSIINAVAITHAGDKTAGQ